MWGLSRIFACRKGYSFLMDAVTIKEISFFGASFGLSQIDPIGGQVEELLLNATLIS